MRLPLFYGWTMVAVTFVTMGIGVNARTSFSLFFPPIIDEFGWERGVTAGAFSFGFLVSAIMSPLLGRLMDRAGPRAVMELGVALMAGGLLLAPLTTQPWHLYLTIGVMVGAGSVCLGYTGQSLFLPNWSPAGIGHRHCLCRSRYWLRDPAAVGAANHRTGGLAHRLLDPGSPDSGGAGSDQSVAAKAAAGHRA
jgi:MFS family permease